MKCRPFVEPALCELVDRPAPGPDWIHEVKFDGYRMQLRVEHGSSILRSRKGLDWTHRFQEIADAGEPLPDCIIDGEIVALDAQGAPSFAALQAALSDKKTDKLVFFVFDILFAEGEDLRALPLLDRKSRLQAIIDEHLPDHPLVRYVEHFETGGDALAEIRLPDVARRHRLEARGRALSIRTGRHMDQVQMPRRP